MPYGFIYKLTNKINGKPYVGQTLDVGSRFSKYRNLQCKGQCKLYNALKKYGPEQFLFEVIDNANDQAHADALETSYIIKFNSINAGYNCNEGGAHGKYSEESKARMSDAHKGHMHTEESKLKMSMARKGLNTWSKGQKLSEEHVRKMTEANKGKHGPRGFKHSEETKRKMSEMRGGANNPRFGKSLSEETKRKIAESVRLHYSLL